MKALENRTVDPKRKMDILDALHDIRARNSRNQRVGQLLKLTYASVCIGREVVASPKDRRPRLEGSSGPAPAARLRLSGALCHIPQSRSLSLHVWTYLGSVQGPRGTRHHP